MKNGIKGFGGVLVGGALGLALVAGLAWQGGMVHAQNSAQAPQSARIAVVDMIGVVDKLMATGSFKAARDQFDAGQQTKGQQIEAEAKALSEDAEKRKQAAATDEEKTRIDEETRSKMEELSTRYRGMQGETDVFTTSTLADAFKLATETAASVARAKGYTHVFASRTGDLPRDRGAQLAFQEVLLRHVAVMPEGDDLTKEVERELKVDQVGMPGAEGPVADQPPPAPGEQPQKKDDVPKVVPPTAPAPK